MKILLTHAYFLYEDEKELQIMKPYPPLGLQCISAYLEEQGYDNTVFDSTFSSLEALKDHLLEEKPDLIGIYTNLMTKINVVKLLSFIKNQSQLCHTKVVLGGPEVRHHKENFLNAGADIIVFGEGEITMLEIVQFYDDKTAKNLQEIKGIAYLAKDQSMVVNAEQTLIRNLDELPFPNRKKIDQEKYFNAWKENHGYSTITLSTMRGCPYGCNWCSRAVYGKSYRRRSPQKVVEEIIQLQQHYAFDKIWFVDDVFTVSHKWLRAFVECIKQKNVNAPYEIITRADRMNEEVIQLLKASGCFRVWIGAESGSQTILDAMNRMVKVEKVAKMVKLSQKYGLEAGTFIMLGYPGETEKDIQETLNYLRDTNPDHFTLTVAYPIKGTPLYTEVEEHFLQKLDWATSTDRDIDFKRTYTRKYYQYAMNWINYEVYLHRQKLKANFNPKLFLTKLRSAKARVGMYLEKQKSLSLSEK